MRFVLTALAMIGGIVFTLVGLGFLFEPESTGAGFGLVPNGAPGLAVLRGMIEASRPPSPPMRCGGSSGSSSGSTASR